MVKKNLLILLPAFFVFLQTIPLQAEWTQTSGPEGGTVNCLAVSGAGLFAGTSGGVFRSVDHGGSWTAVHTGLTNFKVSSLVVASSHLYAGTWGQGVWRRPLSELQSGNVNITVRVAAPAQTPAADRLYLAGSVNY